MDRRSFIGVLGATAVAGCSGDSHGRDGDRGEGGDVGGDDGATDQSQGGTPAPTATAAPVATDPLRGVSISPQTWDEDGIRAFYEEAAANGALVRWAGDWAELGEDGGTPSNVVGLAEQYDFEPVLDVGVYDTSAGELRRPLDAEQIDRYVEQARSFAEAHHPPSLGLGVETNLLASHDPGGFAQFETLYERARAAIGEVSPGTAVYTVFQLEWLRGLRGGLWGDREGADGDPQWDLLDRFPGDYHGLTTYPAIVYRDPGEIPEDYYESVADRVDAPLAITEIGWPSALSVTGWESDEAEQSAFVERLSDLLEGVPVGPVVWLWLYEQGGLGDAFAGVSLRRDDGSGRPAWDAWQSGL